MPISDVVTQVGVGGIFVILVMKEALGFVQRRNGHTGEQDRRSNVCNMDAGSVEGHFLRIENSVSRMDRQYELLLAIKNELCGLRGDMRRVLDERSHFSRDA